MRRKLRSRRWIAIRWSALSLVFGVCLLGLPPAAQSAEPDDAIRFVMADVVKLREAPSRDATVLANLRINTSVTVDAEASADGWARVSLDNEPPLTGYVASAFLGAEPQTAEALHALYMERVSAGNLDRAKVMAERLVALEPEKTEHLNLLRSVYERLGDTAGVDRVDSYLRGDGTKFLGFCTPNLNGDLQAILLAEYRPGHGLTPWLATIPYGISLGDRIEADSLTRTSLALQRSPWFSLDRSGPRRPVARSGTPFAGASVVPPSPHVWGGYMEGEKLVLDADCADPGAVLSTEPVRPMPTETIDQTTIADMISAIPSFEERYEVESVSAERILDGRPLISAEVRVKGATLWILLDGSTGKPMWSVGFYSMDLGDSDSVRGVTWFTWPLSGDRVVIVEHLLSVEKGVAGSRIDVLVVDDENNIDVLYLTPNWYQNT